MWAILLLLLLSQQQSRPLTEDEAKDEVVGCLVLFGAVVVVVAFFWLLWMLWGQPSVAEFMTRLSDLKDAISILAAIPSVLVGISVVLWLWSAFKK